MVRIESEKPEDDSAFLQYVIGQIFMSDDHHLICNNRVWYLQRTCHID